MVRSFRSLVCCLLFLASWLVAQEFRATVTGNVTDSSGAIMPDVKVQITNVATNTVVSSPTNAQGVYHLPFLTPGTYRLTAERPGFKKFVRENIILSVGDTTGIDIALEVGNVGESVTVSAQSVVLQTENAERGLVMDTFRVTELPLSARNPMMLAVLSTAVTYNGSTQYMRPFDNIVIAINGGRSNINEWLLDGAPNTQVAGYTVAMIPPVDSVEEFKIQTSSYDAAFGDTAGGVINVTTKSGTNAYHGSAYEFLRRAPLDANLFQNKAVGQPYAGHYLDQWGGSIGGPLTIPKLYNGRDKSFFFFNYEPYREGTPTPLTLSVPQPEMLTGDFSKLVDSKGSRISIYDPSSAIINADGSVTRQVFPNNTMPASRLNPVMQKVMGYFAKPTVAAGPGSGYGINDLFIPGGSDNLDHDSFYNMVIRFDENLGDKHRLFFREGSNDRTEIRNTGGSNGPGWTGPDPQKRINDAYVFDWVGAWTPSLVTDARVSFGRFVQTGNGVGVHNCPFDATTLGFPRSLLSQLPVSNCFGAYTFTGLTPLGQDPGGFTYNNTWALALSVTKVAGRHTIKFGADLRRIYFNSKQPGTQLDLGFDPTWTQKTYNLADSTSGNSWASALLGLPATGTTNIATSASYLNPYYAPFIQDDIKLTHKLTVNLGLRYDVWPGPQEKYGRMTRGFDPNATNPVDASVNRTQFPGYPTVKGGLMYVTSGQTAYNYYSNTWQPRFGFAYQISEKLVMRGGFGRYMINPTNSWLQTTGFSSLMSLTNSLDSGKTPVLGLVTNPYPSGLIQPVGNTLGLGTFVGQSIPFANVDFKIPYVNQFTFGFQYALPAQSKLEVSYAGSRSYNLEQGCDYTGACTGNAGYNLPSLATRKLCNPMEGGTPSYCDALLPNPFYGLPQFVGTSIGKSPTLSRYALAAPFPEFGTISQLETNNGKIWYNSLAVSYTVRAQKGLSVTFAYTFSKDIEQSGLIDPQAGVMERGLGIWDRTHVAKISGVYELPFGKGKSLLPNAGRALNALVGGWEYNTIVTLNSGLPWTLPAGTMEVGNTYVAPNWHSPVVIGANQCVGQVNDNGSVTLMPYSANIAGCTTSTIAFLKLPRYSPSIGPLQSSSSRLESQHTVDMSLAKTIRFTERMRFQFRVEAFDAFNSYCYPRSAFNNTITSSSFGTLTPANTTVAPMFNRQIQLGMKFMF